MMNLFEYETESLVGVCLCVCLYRIGGNPFQNLGGGIIIRLMQAIIPLYFLELVLIRNSKRPI